MTNPLSGIVSTDFKQLYVYAIEALTEADSLSRPCTLEYTGASFSVCDNCHYDVINKRSSGRYKTGGPIAFASGQQCPRCNGDGQIPSSSPTSTVDMIVLYDSRRWIQLANMNLTLQAPNSAVQTLSNVDTYDEIKRCNTAIMNTDVENHGTQKYIRMQEPVRLGLGSDAFVLTMWEKV